MKCLSAEQKPFRSLYRWFSDFVLITSLDPRPQVDLIERRSRRDMSPQGRKRVAGMVSRDYQTVSGVGGTQTYPHQVIEIISQIMLSKSSTKIESNFSLRYNEEANRYP